MSEITWGDTVRLREGAELEERVGSLAAVCGIRTADTQEQATEFGCVVGCRIILIEFGDGESVEIAEKWLSPFAED